MPDIHQGYGFPIGGVAATDYEEGVVSPGGVGFDINCGVRLVVPTSRGRGAAETPGTGEPGFPRHPCGTGGRAVRLSERELKEILSKGRGGWWRGIRGGAGFGVRRGKRQDRGRRSGAGFARAKERGRPQLGTLGSGNHFLEVQMVEQIHYPEAARAMNIRWARWWCCSTAARAGWGTRSARISWRRWVRR